MTQPSLLDVAASPPLSALLVRNSACARLARLLIERKGQWVNADELIRVAGRYAWRTRISELRAAPWFLDVANQYRHVSEDGRKWIVSEYRLV